MNINDFIGKLKCIKCGGNIADNLKCNICKTKVNLASKKNASPANESFGEKIFDIPFLYNLKIRFLNKLNQLKIPIDPAIKNKEILDLGCGSYQVRYDPSLAKLRIGIDPSAKALMKAQELYPESFHLIGSADSLPFKNKSFQVTLLLFTLHHLNANQWENTISEVKRVTKDKIIIYDHISHDSIFFKSIQLLYWKIFDGGLTYPTESEWKEKLKTFMIKKYKRVGTLFGHICFYELNLK